MVITSKTAKFSLDIPFHFWFKNILMTKVFWLFQVNFIRGIFLMDNPYFLLDPLLMIVQNR